MTLDQVGELASSRSAMKTFAPELSALIIILRSVGPVISTRRSIRPAEAGATRQSPSRTDLVSERKSSPKLWGIRARRCSRVSSNSRRRSLNVRCKLATDSRASFEKPCAASAGTSRVNCTPLAMFPPQACIGRNTPYSHVYRTGCEKRTPPRSQSCETRGGYSRDVSPPGFFIHMTSVAIGIIANPASGKDIRRLVAHASTFDNNEKINIVRRALLGMDAVGVEEVWHLPDSYFIVHRAADGLNLALSLRPLPMEILGNSSDSYEAARRMADLGVGAIMTLGGDGTNRVVAKGCGEVPLVAVSTG